MGKGYPLEVVVFEAKEVGVRVGGSRPADPPAGLACKIQFGKKGFITDSAKARTCEPRWQTVARFTAVEISEEPSQTPPAVVLTVVDKRNRFLGRVRVPVTADLLTKSRINAWYNLLDKKGHPSEKYSGELHVEVSYQMPKDVVKQSPAQVAQHQQSAREELFADVPKKRPTTMEEMTQRLKEDPEFMLEQMDLMKQNMRESTQRSLATLESCRDVASSSAVTLQQNGKKLRDLTDDMEHIDSLLEDSDRHLTVIESWFGGIKNAFKRRQTNRSGTFTPEGLASNRIEREEQLKASVIRENTVDEGMRSDLLDAPAGTVPPSAVRAHTQPQLAEDEQVDRDLDRMGDVLGDLKRIALAMNDELADQAVTIEKVNTHIDVTGDNMFKTMMRTTRAG